MHLLIFLSGIVIGHIIGSKFSNRRDNYYKMKLSQAVNYADQLSEANGQLMDMVNQKSNSAIKKSRGNRHGYQELSDAVEQLRRNY